jgi:hypothetical protein
MQSAESWRPRTFSSDGTVKPTNSFFRSGIGMLLMAFWILASA